MFVIYLKASGMVPLNLQFVNVLFEFIIIIIIISEYMLLIYEYMNI